MYYSKEMQNAIKTVKKPFPVTVHVVALAGALGIRIYEDEVMEMSESKRVQLLEYLNLVQATLESFGMPVVLEGAQGKPGG